MDMIRWTALALILFGCLFLIGALLIPPPGEVHASVLVAFGEIATFAGTLLGIRRKSNKQ